MQTLYSPNLTLLNHENALNDDAGIHKKPNGGANQPRGYNARLETEKQTRSVGKDRGSHVISFHIIICPIYDLVCVY